jgi:hypothetical protein
MTLANSFPPDDPLRQTFLTAAPIRRIGRVKAGRQPAQ